MYPNPCEFCLCCYHPRNFDDENPHPSQLSTLSNIQALWQGDKLLKRDIITATVKLIKINVALKLVINYFFFVITAWKVSVIGVILVRIFPHSDWIRRDTPYLRIQSVCGKMRTRITPNTNTFPWNIFYQITVSSDLLGIFQTIRFQELLYSLTL